MRRRKAMQRAQFIPHGAISSGFIIEEVFMLIVRILPPNGVPDSEPYDLRLHQPLEILVFHADHFDM